MIFISKEHVDVLFQRNIKDLKRRANIVLYKHIGKQLFCDYDLIDECYIRIRGMDGKCFNDEDHFLMTCYMVMRDVVRMARRRESFRKENLFDPQESLFSENKINGFNSDEVIYNVLDIDSNESSYGVDEESIERVKFCISIIKNETHKRIINLLSMNVPMDRIGELLGINNKGNLRAKIHEARKMFFKNIQAVGIYSDKKYSDFNRMNPTRREGYNFEFSSVFDNKFKYMYTDYPEDETFDNRLLFIIRKNSNVSKERLAGILAVNEYKEAINSTRIKTNKYLDILQKQNRIHISSDGYIFIN